MMKLKKTVAVALATAMLASVAAVPAFADNTTGAHTVKTIGTTTTMDGSALSGDVTTTVTYEVTQTYTWSIPKDIDFGSNAGVGATVVVSTDEESQTNKKNAACKVSVTENIIPEGKKLVIKAKGSGASGAFSVQTGNSTTLNYNIYLGTDMTTAVQPNGTILEVAAGKDADSKNMTFKLSTKSGTKGTDSEIAGKYTGTVTYTATVE